MDTLLYLVPLFSLIALVYSLGGLAGGSSYLFVLLLFGISHETAPKIALLANIIVASGGCYFFIRAGHMKLRKILPFLLTSVPAAYWGASIPVSRKIFTMLLAFCLGMAALRLLLAKQSFSPKAEVSAKETWGLGLPIGALLGVLSGVSGIGGGIFLAPVLFGLRWLNAKEVAAATSLFILVNSFSGLFGQISKGGAWPEISWLLPLLAAACLGGQIGSRLAAQRLSFPALRRVTASLLVFVSVTLFLGAL
jgi:uncharacterized membrane protein YfcA